MAGIAMLDWGEKTQGNSSRGTDPRERCWLKPVITNGSARKKRYLIKMFRLYRNIIPVSDKTSFVKNRWCSNSSCVNPFHYSAKGGC